MIELQFVLTRRDVAGPLLSETYRVETVVTGRDMHDFARAMQDGLEEVLDALNHDIQELVTKNHALTL